MLAAHLDPTTDAASRRPATIDHTVDWLLRMLQLRPSARVLDLGCGPGLYCQRFAERGLTVTGVDLSEHSLEHARAQAAQHGLPITYLHQDYRRLACGRQFDLAVLIYYDLCVLPELDRDAVLAGAAAALRPGGAFVCDVTTPTRPLPPDGASNWDVRPAGGFWRPGPYLELTRYHRYPGDVDLRQTVIFEPGCPPVVYRIWNQAYTPTTIAAALDRAGLALESLWADLGGAPARPGDPALGVIARKR